MVEFAPQSWIKDISLAPQGNRLIEKARENMPGISAIIERYGQHQPLINQRIAVCVIPTPETANLVWALDRLGAQVRLCSDNVKFTNDEVAAAVTSYGIPVFAKRYQSRDEFVENIRLASRFPDRQGNLNPPTRIIDDGADMTLLLHREEPRLLSSIEAVTEQTTCGVNFDRELRRKGLLQVPVVDINTGIKAELDNRYGPRESFIPSVKAIHQGFDFYGKTVLVVGYGMVGKGIVDALKKENCKIIIAEANIKRALEVEMDGLKYSKVDNVLGDVDLVVTASSTPHNLTAKQILQMKKGAVICNMGENLEYNAHELPKIDDGINREEITPDLIRYKRNADGWFVDSLCDGYLLNMATGGNPSRIVSVTMALHLLAQIKISLGQLQVERGKIVKVPQEIQDEALALCFPELVDKLTNLTPSQREYMGLA